MKGAEKGRGVREGGRRDFINEESSSRCVEAHGPSRGWDAPGQGAVKYLVEGGYRR